MTQAIIFDFDGLLVDTEIISYQIYKEILAATGYDFTLNEYSQIYSGKSELNNVNTLITTHHLQWSVEAALRQITEIEKRLLSQGVSLKKGARELLYYLKENNYNILIASSSTEERAVNILKQHDILHYFDFFVFGDEVKNGKPNPDIFLKACEKACCEPSDCLVLEDSEAGIQAAFSANIPVICIPDLKIPGEDFLNKTTAVLNSLEEVISFLRKS